jgi:hypothetical protein
VLKKAYEDDRKRALAYKDAGRLDDARLLMARMKLMKTEIDEIADMEAPEAAEAGAAAASGSAAPPDADGAGPVPPASQA